ncbi:MAG TPA: hypothetical protein PKD80_15720 [Microthrixaceae bacterium]|nr:hypothetical protein [Microthrixaceae bacterium]HMT24280.1 hypothetical protein [Microthrixaceae bacterium]HMT62474.1 hypothetical protein [Microthrixaceae bacterium]
MRESSIEPTPEHRLLYDEAVRAIDHQLASVDAAQTRAGLLIAALTISAAELGGRAADRPGNPFPVAQVIAWASLVVCASALLFAIWPRDLKGSFKVEKLAAKAADHLVQDIAEDLAIRRAENGAVIERMWTALALGIISLVVNLCAWASIVIWR